MKTFPQRTHPPWMSYTYSTTRNSQICISWWDSFQRPSPVSSCSLCLHLDPLSRPQILPMLSSSSPSHPHPHNSNNHNSHNHNSIPPHIFPIWGLEKLPTQISTFLQSTNPADYQLIRILFSEYPSHPSVSHCKGHLYACPLCVDWGCLDTVSNLQLRHLRHGPYS